MVKTVFIIIIIILIVDFIFSRILAYLNIRSSKLPIPDVLAGMYDEEKYKKQQSYLGVNSRLGMLAGTFSFLIIIFMYGFGGFGWLDSVVSGWSKSPILISLVFFGILFLAGDMLSIPFDIYSTFVIEERFGFNKTTPRTFILDKLKEYALTLAVGGGILTLVMWIYQINPDYFWLIAWACVSAFGLFMSMFYSELIVPIFNKQTPLEPGELRDAIEKFSSKADFSLKIFTS